MSILELFIRYVKGLNNKLAIVESKLKDTKENLEKR